MIVHIEWGLIDKELIEALEIEHYSFVSHPEVADRLCSIGFLERGVRLDNGIVFVEYALTSIGQLAREQLYDRPYPIRIAN